MRTALLLVGIGLFCGCGRDGTIVDFTTGTGGVGGSGGASGEAGHGGGGANAGEGGDHGCGFESECDPMLDDEANKPTCNDGDPFTADRCVAVADCGGVCAHTETECDWLDPVVIQMTQCEDGDECTTGRCIGPNKCTQVNSGACGM